MIRLVKTTKKNVFYQIEGKSYIYWMKNLLCHNKKGLASRDATFGEGSWWVNGVEIGWNDGNGFDESFLIYWSEVFAEFFQDNDTIRSNGFFDDFEVDYEFKRVLKYAKLFAEKRLLKRLKMLKKAYRNKNISKIKKLLGKI